MDESGYEIQDVESVLGVVGFWTFVFKAPLPGSGE